MVKRIHWNIAESTCFGNIRIPTLPYGCSTVFDTVKPRRIVFLLKQLKSNIIKTDFWKCRCKMWYTEKADCKFAVVSQYWVFEIFSCIFKFVCGDKIKVNCKCICCLTRTVRSVFGIICISRNTSVKCDRFAAMCGLWTYFAVIRNRAVIINPRVIECTFYIFK